MCPAALAVCRPHGSLATARCGLACPLTSSVEVRICQIQLWNKADDESDCHPRAASRPDSWRGHRPGAHPDSQTVISGVLGTSLPGGFRTCQRLRNGKTGILHQTIDCPREEIRFTKTNPARRGYGERRPAPCPRRLDPLLLVVPHADSEATLRTRAPAYRMEKEARAAPLGDSDRRWTPEDATTEPF